MSNISSHTATDARFTIVKKGVDEVVNNSNVYQNDDELLFQVAANEQVNFLLFLYFSSAAAADIKWKLTLPAGASGTAQYMLGAVINSIDLSGINADGTGIANKLCLMIIGHINTAATPGQVTLQWAQNTADASDTKVYAGSQVVVYR